MDESLPPCPDRWEKKVENYEAMLHFACGVIVLEQNPIGIGSKKIMYYIPGKLIIHIYEIMKCYYIVIALFALDIALIRRFLNELGR